MNAPAAERPLRVVQLTATFPPYLGGAGTVALGLSRELAARGHEVEIVTAAGGGGPHPDTGRARLTRIQPRFAIGNAPLLPPIARLRHFDVLHLHYPFIFGGELALAALRRNPAAALVVSYHNRLIGDGARAALFRGYEETAARAIVRRADRIAVVSRPHAETVPYLARLLRTDPDRIAELPNGVDTGLFAPGGDGGLRDRLKIPSEAIAVSFVATLDRAHHLKRADVAIQAIAEAQTPAHLILAGGGDWEERFRAQAAAARIGERVHFLGAVQHDGLPDVIRASDMLLVSSDLESFGIVLIEAMACGVPTVSTDLPGILAVVRPGETGLVAPRGDTKALAAAIDELARAGPAARRSMGAAGRKLCEGRYAWPRLAERLEAIYVGALERRRNPSRPRS